MVDVSAKTVNENEDHSERLWANILYTMFNVPQTINLPRAENEKAHFQCPAYFLSHFH